MSFTQSIYDPGAYAKELDESMYPGQYKLMPDAVQRETACFDVSSVGRGVPRQLMKIKDVVDSESDVFNLKRKYSRDPDLKYLPNDSVSRPAIPISQCSTSNSYIHSRLDDPLFKREQQVQIKRFESLCIDPQHLSRIRDNSFIGRNTRLFERDMYQPSIPTPLASSNSVESFSSTLQPIKCSTCK